jgi:Xaa-Pro aminopeptidase
MRPHTPAPILSVSRTPTLLITNLANLRYLTGLTMSAGALLVTPKKFILFVDARYTDMAKHVADRFQIRDAGDFGDVLTEFKTCGYESDDVTVDRLLRWKKKFPKVKFIETRDVIQHFRRQKDDEEIRNLKRARRITQELLRRVPTMLRKSITEEQLARQIIMWALELGAEGMSFEPIVAFGTHTACPHHRPTSRSLQKGHIVQIDIGAKYKGYCADMSEVFFTTTPTKVEAEVYRTLCHAKKHAIAAAKAGITNHDLDDLARAILNKAGIEQYFTHSLGHGVGLDIHEGISLSSKANETALLKNEVVAVEPGAYFPGKFGMRVEDMVFVS